MRALTRAALAEREEHILRLIGQVMTGPEPQKAAAMGLYVRAVEDFNTLVRAWNARHPDAPMVERGRQG